VNGTHLGTFIRVRYTDLLGLDHFEYFVVVETYSAVYAKRDSGQESLIGKECSSLVESLISEAEMPDHPITVAHLQVASFKLPYVEMAPCVGEPSG
jgi:hypothetical protein